ncbi:hypothetical protein KZ829_06715 [Actinoplanes hulinensis]|uniref:Uncharacterized protein n=1 Tax=Actinoplanes hulinensis TaxID=1144547 RepID=A0ABS7AZC3_9ACTN|nr:hypothetical protein [Actinoplanes hulinensis]MBW6433433.1 hypothetical protein [Actinoplanes hulinensis]
MREPTAGAIVRAWLNGAVESTTGGTAPAGCLLVQGALTGGEAATLPAAQRHGRALHRPAALGAAEGG